jgi:ribosomal protein S18 acetylase RimI-like enzyme
MTDSLKLGEIAALYVASDHHREGVGAALLRAAAAELRRLGVRTLRLDVLTANLPARRFYEAVGGREVGRGTTDEEGVLLPTTVYEWTDASETVDR